jgi:hypothetical protein
MTINRHTASDVEEKAFAWLDAGTSMDLSIDPATRTVRAYRSRDRITVFGEDAEVDAGDVVPGWRFPVRALFQ